MGFASRSVGVHLARGFIGLGAFAAAILLARVPSAGAMAGSVVLALAGLAALKGCPMCWTMGLIETCRMHKANPLPSDVGAALAGREGGAVAGDTQGEAGRGSGQVGDEPSRRAVPGAWR